MQNHRSMGRRGLLVGPLVQSKLLLEARHLPGASVSRSKVLHYGGLISSPNFPCLVAAAMSLPLCQHQGQLWLPIQVSVPEAHDVACCRASVGPDQLIHQGLVTNE